MIVSLKDLASKVADIEQLIIDADGELSADWEKDLESLQLSIEAKLDSIAYIMKRKNANIEMMKSMTEQLKTRIKREENEYERMHDYTFETMKTQNIFKLEGFNKLALHKKAASLEVTDEALIPKSYINNTVSFKIGLPEWEVVENTLHGFSLDLKVTPAPDKVRILKDLKDNITIPGCKLVEGEKKLDLK